MAKYQVYARFTDKSIIVYQLVVAQQAEQVLEAKNFPLDFHQERTLWITPSFWRVRHQRKHKPQKNWEYILAVHLRREYWENLLHQTVLIDYNPSIYYTQEIWQSTLKSAPAIVQWVHEHTLKYWIIREKVHTGQISYTLQMGIRPQTWADYCQNGIIKVENTDDLLYKSRQTNKKYPHLYKGLQPLILSEKEYPLTAEVQHRLWAKNRR